MKTETEEIKININIPTKKINDEAQAYDNAITDLRDFFNANFGTSNLNSVIALAGVWAAVQIALDVVTMGGIIKGLMNPPFEYPDVEPPTDIPYDIPEDAKEYAEEARRIAKIPTDFWEYPLDEGPDAFTGAFDPNSPSYGKGGKRYLPGLEEIAKILEDQMETGE